MTVFLLCCISASISQFVLLARRHHSAASCTSDWTVHIIHFNIYPPSPSLSFHHFFPFTRQSSPSLPLSSLKSSTPFYLPLIHSSLVTLSSLPFFYPFFLFCPYTLLFLLVHSPLSLYLLPPFLLISLTISFLINSNCKLMCLYAY